MEMEKESTLGLLSEYWIYITGVFCVLLIGVKYQRKVGFFWTLVYFFYINSLQAYMARYFGYYNSHVNWSDHSRWFLNVKMHELPGSHKLIANRQNKTILLLNHRSVADFFLHDCITKYNASFLARSLVAYLFPLSAIGAWAFNSVWFFKRGGRGNNLEPFFTWIDQKFNSPRTIRKSLMVYAEGHRNVTMEPLKLKIGFIRYAFERGCMLQIVQSFGLEQLMNDKTMEIDLSGMTIHYYYDEPINPKDFNSLGELYEFVSDKFNKSFRLARDMVYTKK